MGGVCPLAIGEPIETVRVASGENLEGVRFGENTEQRLEIESDRCHYDDGKYPCTGHRVQRLPRVTKEDARRDQQHDGEAIGEMCEAHPGRQPDRDHEGASDDANRAALILLIIL